MQGENRCYLCVTDLMKKKVGKAEGSPTANIYFVFCNVHFAFELDFFRILYLAILFNIKTKTTVLPVSCVPTIAIFNSIQYHRIL